MSLKCTLTPLPHPTCAGGPQWEGQPPYKNILCHPSCTLRRNRLKELGGPSRLPDECGDASRFTVPTGKWVPPSTEPLLVWMSHQEG